MCPHALPDHLNLKLSVPAENVAISSLYCSEYVDMITFTTTFCTSIVDRLLSGTNFVIYGWNYIENKLLPFFAGDSPDPTLRTTSVLEDMIIVIVSVLLTFLTTF